MDEGEDLVERGRGTVWPAEGRELWAELSRFRGRLALVIGDPWVAEALAQVAGTEPCHVGRRLSQFEAPPTPGQVASAFAGDRVLLDLDVLFDSAVSVDPIRLLRDQARVVGGVVAVWPGEVLDGTAAYSRPGRFDRYVSSLADTLVLRSRPVVFPDETPYAMERIP